MNEIKKEISVQTIWNLCSFDLDNLPNKSGLYLTINAMGRFEILQFYVKGDVISTETIEKYGINRTITASESSFYENDEKLERVVVVAWTKLPDDSNELLNLFIDKEHEVDAKKTENNS